MSLELWTPLPGSPGAYTTPDGVLHIDLTEMLEANGWPDTPHNRAMMESASREVFGTVYHTQVVFDCRPGLVALKFEQNHP